MKLMRPRLTRLRVIDAVAPVRLNAALGALVEQAVLQRPCG
jgi:hypothetical protein